MGVTWVSQGLMAVVHVCFKYFLTWVSQMFYMDFTQVLQNCLMGATGCCTVLREYYRGLKEVLLGVLTGCYMSVTGVLQSRCCRTVCTSQIISWYFPTTFSALSKYLPSTFPVFSRYFPGTFSVLFSPTWPSGLSWSSSRDVHLLSFI